MADDWFDLNNFVVREPRGSRRVDGPINMTQPVGGPVPQGGAMPAYQASAPPGMTVGDLTGIVNDPNVARMSSGGGGTEPFSEDAFFNHMEQYPPTNEGMRAGYAAAQAKWGNAVPKLLEHPQRLDKFQFADGRTFDVIGGAGGPNPSWVRNLDGPGHGGAAGTLGGMMGGNWQAGKDPSYQFVYDEAIKALDKSNAARGISKTGGAYKALVGLGQNLASTEFSNIFGRNLSLAQLGLGAAGQAAGVGSAYSGQAGNLTGNQAAQNSQLVTGAGNAAASGTVGSANAWGNTIGGLANIGGQWMAGRGKRMDDPYGVRTPPFVPEPGGY